MRLHPMFVSAIAIRATSGRAGGSTNVGQCAQAAKVKAAAFARRGTRAPNRSALSPSIFPSPDDAENDLSREGCVVGRKLLVYETCRALPNRHSRERALGIAF